MMSSVRSYLPESVNENLMYGIGVLRCYAQPYLNTKFNANALQTEPRILVGDLASASNREAMHDQGVTHILCVLNGGLEQFPEEFKYMVVHANDDPWVDIETHFDDAIKFIDDALTAAPDSKILVHCQRGASRSVTLVAAYLLYNMNRVSKIDEEKVGDMVRGVIATIHNVRDIACPNEGFVLSLHKYVCRLNRYAFPQVAESQDDSEEVTVSDTNTNAINAINNLDVEQMEDVVDEDDKADVAIVEAEVVEAVKEVVEKVVVEAVDVVEEIIEVTQNEQTTEQNEQTTEQNERSDVALDESV